MRHIGILKDKTITFVKYDGPGYIKDVLMKYYRTLEKIEELISKVEILEINEDGSLLLPENPSGPYQTDSLDEFDEGYENFLFNCDKGSWTPFYTNYSYSGEVSRRKLTLYV